MTLKVVLITATCMGLLVAVVGMTHGAFATVQITEREAGPYEFVYRTAPRGDFGSVRTITTELERAFRGIGVREMQPLDVFYPSSSQAPSEIGFIVSSADVAK